ncbi:hypothetical protein CM19_12605 [Candidatus Acidianus copahuensis]|uniref:Uncharacterized protein n=1 Tax=Candidatus Acidianus copahuensis TaxID=1160895 RepID=A0A031LHK9_9CREN|nr:hypothetical protein [Candidatus Acidianus copahuensis]EZQ01647.1 hypothetical protein CM19_12605 [Candidatus Acidianus copahuensis]
MKASLDRVIKYLESYAKEKGIMIDLRSNLQYKTVRNGFTVEGILTINDNQYDVLGEFYGRLGLSNFKNEVKSMIDKEYDDINKALSVLARKSSEIKKFSEFIKEIESNIKTEATIAITTIRAKDVIEGNVKIDRLRQKRFLAKRINNYVLYYRFKHNIQLIKNYS